MGAHTKQNIDYPVFMGLLSGVKYLNWPRPLPDKFFPICYSPITLPFNATQAKVLTAM